MLRRASPFRLISLDEFLIYDLILFNEEKVLWQLQFETGNVFKMLKRVLILE